MVLCELVWMTDSNLILEKLPVQSQGSMYTNNFMVTTTKEETHKRERLLLAQESRKRFHKRCKCLCGSKYKGSNFTIYFDTGYVSDAFTHHHNSPQEVIAHSYPPFSAVETEAMSSAFPGVMGIAISSKVGLLSQAVECLAVSSQSLRDHAQGSQVKLPQVWSLILPLIGPKENLYFVFLHVHICKMKKVIFLWFEWAATVGKLPEDHLASH